MMMECSLSNKWLKQELRAYTLVHKQKAGEGAHWCESLETSRPAPGDTPSPTRPPHPSPKVPTSKDQVFKQMSLWGTFSFKPSEMGTSPVSHRGSQCISQVYALDTNLGNRSQLPIRAGSPSPTPSVLLRSFLLE